VYTVDETENFMSWRDGLGDRLEKKNPGDAPEVPRRLTLVKSMRAQGETQGSLKRQP
jgi:hypothetical protein